MYRKPLIFSLICTIGLTIWGLKTWLGLPDIEQYPIHWNAAGKADGFAGRNAVLGVLMIIPITQIFITVMFYFIPKIEPLKKNFEDSRGAYKGIWVGTMALVTLAGIMIIKMYHGDNANNSETQTATALLSISAISIGTSLFFILIGNVLGKVRQNFMLGIRTPWTLSSELSWEKTHRLGGKLFVVSGILGLIISLMNPLAGILGMTALILITVIICLIYSYKVWKADPNKRS